MIPTTPTLREQLQEVHDLIFAESNCYDTVAEEPCLCGLCVGMRRLREIIDTLPGPIVAVGRE